MKFAKILLSASLLLSGLTAAAQTEETTENVFNPHWYLQAQIGVQETLGETDFGALMAPTAQVAVGYNFSKIFGLRLGVNAWQSKAAWEWEDSKNKYDWNYVAPHLDLTIDLTNTFGGYNPDRVVGVGIFGGVGANIGFNNDEAYDVKTKLASEGLDACQLYWDGTKVRFLGTFGAYIDFKISSRVKLGIEINANTLGDAYNSKKAGNADWYFNGLVGVKIALGKTNTKKTIPAVEPTIVTEYIHDTIYIDREVVREVVREVPAPAPKETLRRDVFFTISNTTISAKEQQKVDEVVAFMKKYPDSKVTVTGYADKGTGSVATNMRLSKQRAETVSKAIVDQGIASDRVITKAMDESFEQPYPDPVQNRVSICIVE